MFCKPSIRSAQLHAPGRRAQTPEGCLCVRGRVAAPCHPRHRATNAPARAAGPRECGRWARLFSGSVFKAAVHIGFQSSKLLCVIGGLGSPAGSWDTGPGLPEVLGAWLIGILRSQGRSSRHLCDLGSVAKVLCAGSEGVGGASHPSPPRLPCRLSMCGKGQPLIRPWGAPEDAVVIPSFLSGLKASEATAQVSPHPISLCNLT